MITSCATRWAAARSFRSQSRPQAMSTLCNLHLSLSHEFSSLDSSHTHPAPATPIGNSKANETEPARPQACSPFVRHAVRRKSDRSKKRGKMSSLLQQTMMVNASKTAGAPFGIAGILQLQNCSQEEDPMKQTLGHRESNQEEAGGSKFERVPSMTSSNSESEKETLDRLTHDPGHKQDASCTPEPTAFNKSRTQNRTDAEDRPPQSKTKKWQFHKKPKSNNTTRNKNHENMPSPKSDKKFISENVTTSEWVLVSNIPPMSKFSDLLPSLTNILEFEIKKGIIDLDKLLRHKNNAIDSSSFQNQDAYDRLKEINALDSLYSHQTIQPDGTIPLWTFHPDPHRSLPAQLIIEARLHLSYRARPMGWFLRFANRSVAHAVRCHVREAERHEGLIREQFKSEGEAVRRARRLWTEGLWKRVWEDYEARAVVKKNELMPGKEHGEKRERMGGEDALPEEESKLMWGEDVPSEQDWDDKDIADVGVCVDTASKDDVGMEGDNETSDLTGRQSVDDFFDEYARSHPYPMHSTSMPSVEAAFGYHRLTCGSTPLHIQEFIPATLPLVPKQPTWEQNSFHLGNLLDLSDSVVRVETSLKTTVDEVRYLFRAYDMKSIWPEPSGHKEQLPSWCADLPKSIGWNLSRYETTGNATSQVAVGILIKGKKPNEHLSSGNRQHGRNIDGPSRNMFLVRFATPADARMAVREKQGIEWNERRLLLSQYPRVELM